MKKKKLIALKAHLGSSPFWSSLLFSAAVLLLFLLIFSPDFETDDDATLMHLIDGSRGSTDPHLICQNVLLGFFYQALYRLPVRLPWYSLFQYALLLASVTALCYVLRSLFPGAPGRVWCAALTLFLGWECYICIQFTKTAGAAACAGICLMLLTLSARTDAHRKQRLICGGLLVLLGSLLRLQQAAACILLLSGAGLFLLITEKTKTGLAALIKRCLLSFGILAVLLAGAFWADRISYQVSGLGGLPAFNYARARLLDYGLPDYKENKAALKKLGISRAAYRMFKSWAFADPDVFTTETLQAMLAMKPKKKLFSRSQAVRFLQECPGEFLSKKFFFLLLPSAIFCLLFCRRRKAAFLAAGYEITLFLLFYYYLYYRGRFRANRVAVPLMLAVFLCFLFLCCDRDQDGRPGWNRPSMQRKAGASAAFALCLLGVLYVIPAHAPSILPLVRGSESEQAARLFMHLSRSRVYEAAADPEHLYLAKLYTLSEDPAFGVFDTAPENCLSNILWLGGWSYNSPCYRNTMKRFHITNPLRDMVGNPSVRLVDNKPKLTLKYLRTHYGKEISFRQTGSFGPYPIYTVLSSPEP